MEDPVFDHEIKLLCSHAKLDRDKGYLALTAAIKNFVAEHSNTATTATDTAPPAKTFPSFEERLLSFLSQSTDIWEETFGHIEACKVLIEQQTFSQHFPTDVLARGLVHLEHNEFRVRISAGQLLGKLCSVVDVQFYEQCEQVLIGSIRKNLTRDIPADVSTVPQRPESPNNSMKNIFHESAGWKSLETSMKGLQAIIEGCKDSFLQFINLDLLNLIFETLGHDNRFVRETGYYLCASLARYGVCSSDNSNKEMANMLASHLFTGLSDNWSQVRLAASVATRQFFQDFNEADKVAYYRQLLPPMCLNRYYLAEGVRLYNQESWRLLLTTEGRKYVQMYIKEVVGFYISQIDSDNHAVREAACHCISELSCKIEHEAVKPYVSGLLDALIVCFRDESWPVRDTACVACGKFILSFPEECRGQLDVLYPLFFDNLSDPIPSVRQGGAVALTNVARAYPNEAVEKLFAHIVKGLETLKEQKAESERYETVSSDPGKYGVVSFKHMHDNDVELHTNQTMYSCGSLAPKMRAGGCMDHAFKRKSEPWEVADGCIYLIGEMASFNGAHSTVEKCMGMMVDATRNRAYTHHLYLFETINKVLPLIATGLGKRTFKQYLERFFEVIFYTAANNDNALAKSAAVECLSKLSKFLGPNILAGRVEQYDPSCMKYLRVG